MRSNDFDQESLNLNWSYQTFDYLDAIHNTPLNARAYPSFAVKDNKVVIGGFVRADEGITDSTGALLYPAHNTFFLVNDNYGTGSFNTYIENTNRNVEPPVNEDGSIYPAGYSDFRIEDSHSSNRELVFDNNNRVHFTGTYVCTFDDGSGLDQRKYWPLTSYVKDIRFDLDTHQFYVSDVWPKGDLPDDGLLTIPWDFDENGLPDYYNNSTWVFSYEQYPYPYHSPDDAFHYNYSHQTKANQNGWMAMIWSDTYKAYQYHVNANDNFQAFASAPEFYICFSKDNGNSWSGPLIFNAVAEDINYQPVFHNMIPTWFYLAPEIDIIDNDWGKIHLLFMKDNSYGSYIQGDGENTGGRLMYASIKVKFSEIAGTNPPERHFVPVWNGNRYENMNIIVNSAWIDNISIEEGDEIGIFDGQYCVGALKKTSANLNTYSIYAAMNHPQTTAIDGFTPGHEITFKLWKHVTNREFVCDQNEVVYISGDSVFTANGQCHVNLNIDSSYNQLINLKNGWNLVSFNNQSNNMTIPDIFSDLIQENHLMCVMDENDQSYEYQSNVSQWVNQIGAYSMEEAYYVKVNDDCQLNHQGYSVTLPHIHFLSSGWNLMYYPYPYSQFAMPLLGNVIYYNRLVKVMNEKGQTIENLPEIGWVNTIQNFYPGEGYAIKLNSGFNFVYPYQRADEIHLPVSTAVSTERTEHFIPVWTGNGFKHHNFYIKANDFLNTICQPGDEIAIFDGENCVAAKMVNGGESFYSLIASRQDEDSEIVNGFIPGHQFIVKIFRNQQIDMAFSCEVLNGATVFESRGTSFLTINSLSSDDLLHLPKITEIKSIYPNPFNPSTTIQYSLHKNDRVNISVYNAKGQKVTTLFFGMQNAGYHQISWHGQDMNQNHVSSGIYFVKMTSSEKPVTKKILLLK
ncbi:MAG TPA: T9SS type A sorting domain-containing protein [Candidatus Cloacimonadota bacterium]|nr:T9SS type A sorting domain-containing protein [Candidatus Cloacimonadota bacterium]